jgi:hypothetical protein
LRQALAPGNQSLLWRLPDPRRRLRVYIGSQLLALTTLARTWPGHRPLIIITHELALGAWRKFFGLKGTVLIEAGRSVSELAQAATLIISRLDQADTPVLQDLFEDIRVADLGRLPDNRLLLRQGQVSGTLTLSED